MDEQAGKTERKPYHCPELRPCGTVKEQTQYGTGMIPDAEWTTASRASA